jgi:hypothetical protein
MAKLILFALIALSVISPTVGRCSVAMQQKVTIQQNRDWDKTRTVLGLPFCALMLRAFLVEESRREVHVLMEPDQVTEENLRPPANSMSSWNPMPRPKTSVPY